MSIYYHVLLIFLKCQFFNQNIDIALQSPLLKNRPKTNSQTRL